MNKYILVFLTISSFCYADDSISDKKQWLIESQDILLQGFHWQSHQTKPWWNVVEKKAKNIGEAGFTFVWFPPSSAAASDEGYLPHQLYLQDSRYGTVEQLKSAIRSLQQYNVGAIADIVINHRVGTKNWADFSNPEWGSDAVCRDDEWEGASGEYDSGDKYGAARDIDHTKKYVQDSIVTWMKWLRNDIGYNGVRYDYVKGYNGKFNKIYNESVAPEFSVGELWDDLNISNPSVHRQQICDWINATGGTSTAFDFTTKGILQHAVQHNEYWRLKDNSNKPVGVIGWWPEKAVTFIDNHDTGPSSNGGQNHWPFPSDKTMLGYAYILTHPGIPCVYWVHYYDWGLETSIQKIMDVRRSQKISSTSKVDIVVANDNVYAAIIDGKTAMKIGPGDWSPGENWELATSGNDYAIWTKQ